MTYINPKSKVKPPSATIRSRKKKTTASPSQTKPKMDKSTISPEAKAGGAGDAKDRRIKELEEALAAALGGTGDAASTSKDKASDFRAVEQNAGDAASTNKDKASDFRAVGPSSSAKGK